MSKAALISIRPKWCELIASGKKTIEVRKTAPKIKTPFKCYIYCTKEGRGVGEDMTGMEAWAIVAPIIAAHSVPYKKGGKQNLDALDEAYIIVYGALKEHDERRKKEEKMERMTEKALEGKT